MNFNSANVQGMRPQNQQLPMTGQSQFRQQPMPQNVHGNMTSSGLPPSMNSSLHNLEQRGKAVPLPGNMTSYAPPRHLNFQQGGGVMPQSTQGNMTSFRPVNLSQRPQNIPANNMTSSRPPNSVNSRHLNFQQGGLMVTQQNIQASNMTSSAVNLNQHNNFLQGNMAKSNFQQKQQNMMQRNYQVRPGNFQQNQQACAQQRMPNLQQKNLMQQNQISQQNNQPPRVQQVSQQLSARPEQNNNMLNMQQQNDSGMMMQTNQQQGSDFVEKVYQRIVCMRDEYLEELNEVLVNFSNCLQKQQTGNQQLPLGKFLQYKKQLEYLVRILLMNKSDVIRDSHTFRLDQVEKKILEIVNTKRRRASAALVSQPPQLPQPQMEVDGAQDHTNAPASADYSPKTQLPHQPEIINIDDDEVDEARDDRVDASNFEASVAQPQLPQSGIADVCSDHPPENPEIESHASAANSAVSSPLPQLPQTPMFLIDDDLLKKLVKEVYDIDPSIFDVDETVSSPQPQLEIESHASAHSAVSSPLPQPPQTPIFFIDADSDDLLTNLLNEAHDIDASDFAAVGDIAEALTMANPVPPEVGCRPAVRPDFFATTSSGTKRIRRLHP